MNVQEILLTIGDYALLATAIPLALFIAIYRKRKWRQYFVGRTLMYLAVSLLVYVLVVSASVFWGTSYFLREWVRLLAYALVFANACRLVWALLHYGKKPIDGHDELSDSMTPKPDPHFKENPVSLPTVDVVATSTTPTLIPSKYTTAVLTLAIVVIAGFQSALVGGITDVEAYQFGGLVLGGVVTYIAPLLVAGWSAALKVLGAVAGAVLAAIPPIIDTANGGEGFTPQAIVMLIFAGVLALATQFGVDVRVDAAKKAILDPAVDNTETFVLDSAAYNVADRLVPQAAKPRSA